MTSPLDGTILILFAFAAELLMRLDRAGGAALPSASPLGQGPASKTRREVPRKGENNKNDHEGLKVVGQAAICHAAVRSRVSIFRLSINERTPR